MAQAGPGAQQAPPTAGTWSGLPGAPGRVQTLAAVTLRDGPLRGEGEWVRLGWAGLHGLHAATVSDATARTAPHL